MKLLHTSDWHLGRTLHGEDLQSAHEAFVDHLEEVVRGEGVDALLIAGDVYDRGVPSVVSVALLDDALARLSSLTRVVLTPGNHDSAIRLGFSERLLTERVVIRATLGGIGEPVALPAANGATGALLYALPYLDPDAARGPLDAAGRSHQAVMDAAMGRVRADLARRRAGAGTGADARIPALVMAHAFVTGGEASESERDIRVGGVSTVAARTFAGVDYAALGHLHGPQRIGTGLAGGPGDGDAAAVEGREGVPMVRYSGSPLAFSFSEARHRKSSTLLRLDAGGVAATELIDAPVPRALADVRGTLEELGSARFDDARAKYVRVTVTDARRPDHLWERLRALFPYVLVHSHEPPVREGAGDAPRMVGAGGAVVDPLDVLWDFVTEMGGDEPTVRELAVLREVYESVLAAGGSR